MFANVNVLSSNQGWRSVGAGDGRRRRSARRARDGARAKAAITSLQRTSTDTSALHIRTLIGTTRSQLERSRDIQRLLGMNDDITLLLQALTLSSSAGWLSSMLSSEIYGSDPEEFLIVCYGVGPFGSSRIARAQLTLLLMLRDALPFRPRIELYDPVLTPNECRVLETLDVCCLQVNEEGKRRIQGRTVFYMLHCGRALYNNVLWANFDPSRLSDLVIIGNSHSRYVEQKECDSDGASILALSSLWKETRCSVALGTEFAAFNDICVLHFPPEMCHGVDSAFWLSRPQEYIAALHDSEHLLQRTIIPASSKNYSE